MPKITQAAYEMKRANQPKQDLPRYRVSKQREISEIAKLVSQKKSSRNPSYNTAMCATIDCVGFSNAETLQL